MNTIARVSSDMSVPEALLPEQYFDRLAGSAREMPEKRLMAAVLLDALVQLQRAGSAGAADGPARPRRPPPGHPRKAPAARPAPPRAAPGPARRLGGRRRGARVDGAPDRRRRLFV